MQNRADSKKKFSILDNTCIHAKLNQTKTTVHDWENWISCHQCEYLRLNDLVQEFKTYKNNKLIL